MWGAKFARKTLRKHLKLRYSHFTDNFYFFSWQQCHFCTIVAVAHTEILNRNIKKNFEWSTRWWWKQCCWGWHGLRYRLRTRTNIQLQRHLQLAFYAIFKKTSPSIGFQANWLLKRNCFWCGLSLTDSFCILLADGKSMQRFNLVILTVTCLIVSYTIRLWLIIKCSTVFIHIFYCHRLISL